MRRLRPSLRSDSGHRALTQGPLIEAWLMKNDFQPVVGLRFNFRGDPIGTA